jgi:hypothetical protein
MQTADPTNPCIKKVPYTGVQFVGIAEFQSIGTVVGQNIYVIGPMCPIGPIGTRTLPNAECPAFHLSPSAVPGVPAASKPA